MHRDRVEPLLVGDGQRDAGVTDLAEATQPCQRAAVRRARLRMTLTPTRTVVGRKTSYRLRLSSSSARCVRSARLTLGRRTVAVAPDGRATTVRTFRTAGRVMVRTSAPGCRPAVRTITVARR